MDTITQNAIQSIPAAAEQPSQLSMEYILSRIDRIIADTGHVNMAMSALENMPVNISPEGGSGDQAKAQAVADSVKAREATNQQIIRLLEKMYDDIKPKPLDRETQKLENIAGILRGLNKDEYSADAFLVIKKCAQQMFVEPGASIVEF